MDEQRLRRVFDVLGYVAKHGQVTVTEVSRALDLPVSSSHDLLKALAQIDAVAEVRKTYVLGPLALRFSFTVSDGVSVKELARPHLEMLAESSGHDTYLAVRLGSKVVYTSRHPGNQEVNIDIPLGQSLYLHSTAVGKLFAAMDREMYQTLTNARRPALTERTRTSMEQLNRDLRGIRARGLAITRGESVPGILGVAAPVAGPGGRLVAAVHVSVLQASVSAVRLREICELVQRSAVAIEKDLSERAAESA